MAIEDDLRNIQTRISTVQSQRARASVELDNATEKRERAKAALAEFGVKTNDEAKQMLLTLEEDLATATAEVESALEAAGA